MKLTALFYFHFLFALLACGNNDLTTEKATTGKVVRIADGDTFTLLTADKKQVRVRLHGIDAPERRQDFGQVARQQLATLVFGKEVRVVEKKKDRWGRMVALAYTPDGKCVSEEMLRSGLAWHFTRYDNNSHWAQLQQEAQQNKKGLWAKPGAIAPWDWRKQQNEKEGETP